MLNKKMLLSLLVIGVVSVSAGAGTWAYFSDTETSDDNTFTAGTLDLDGTESVTTVTFSDMIPGGNPASQTITLLNKGTMNADETEFDFDLDAFTDDEAREIDVLGAAVATDTASTFAGKIIVDTLTIGTTDLKTGITGTGTGGAVTLADVASAGILTGEGIPADETGKVLTIDVHLDSTADDQFQGDSLTVDIEIALNQDASQTTLIE